MSARNPSSPRKPYSLTPCTSSNMSSTRTFGRFKYLPPELREVVWRDALLEWSVWAPTHAHFNLTVNPVITMKPLGYGADVVGQVCRESRGLMKRLYVKLESQNRQTSNNTVHSAYWLHPDRTILYLGCSPRATDFIEILHAHEHLKIAHVVLRVCQDWVEASRFVYILARNCPGVKTLVLHLIDNMRNASKVCWCENPSPDLAELYKDVVSYRNEAALPYEEPADGGRFRLSFSEFFGESNSEEDEDEDDVDTTSEVSQEQKEDENSNSCPVLHFLPSEVEVAAK